jgi:7-cyano-7-deazaguanine synthase
MSQLKAVCLLSGGLDSATAAAMAVNAGFRVFPLHVQYGQRHSVELSSAENVARALGIGPVQVGYIEVPRWKSSLLKSNDEKPPMDEDATREGVPSTFVPGRNAIFLSMAAAYASSIGAEAIFIGANQVDFSGYPDCRENFLGQMEHALGLAVDDLRFRIHSPLLNMTKASIIRRAEELDVPLGLTVSCYDPTEVEDSGEKYVLSCGRCDSCQIRKAGFASAGVEDPTPYV